MARKLKSDSVLFATTLILVVVSLTWVYSITSVTQKDANDIVMKQAMFVVIGVAGLLGAMRLDYHLLGNRRALLWAAGGIALPLLWVVVAGRRIKGGKRWINLLGFGIQPSEFAKLVVILFVATVLARRMEDQEPMEPGFVQAAALVALMTLLIGIEPDFGTAIVLMAAAFTMMFVAGLPSRWIATAAALVPPPVMAVLWFSQHSRDRLLAYWDPVKYAQDEGYQTLQSLIAVGSGGLWGRGFGQSIQKLNYLPEPQNDYIFAVISEEMGLIGACLIVLCFGLIIARGLLVSRRAPDALGALVALGITAMFGIQAVVNLGVVVNLLPAKGITLPFVSYGGSSMIVSLIAMGVLLNISQQASVTE